MQQPKACRSKGLGNKIHHPSKPPSSSSSSHDHDLTSSLTDELLLRILSLLPPCPSSPCSLVSTRWLRLQSLLLHSIKVHQWSFLQSGRLTARFPNLIDVDLTGACVAAAAPRNSSSALLITHQFLTIQLGTDAYNPSTIQHYIEEQQLPPSTLDKVLKILADGCPGLQRLCVADVRRATYNRIFFRTKEIAKSDKVNGLHDEFPLNGGADGNELEKAVQVGVAKSVDEEENEVTLAGETEDITKLVGSMRVLRLTSADRGLAYIAKKCPTLQELDLHQCTDDSLSAISTCQNLQILRLVGTVNGFYHCTFTDIGLTVLARSCRRLVKLVLSGCEASYDGIAAIGQCCFMLEELTISNQGFYEGWIAALSFCSCLKTLRLEGCRQIDPIPGPVEHLGHCEALERLQIVRCNLRDRAGFIALMVVSLAIRELELQDCWGLDDETFNVAASCRRVKLLSLEGCSLLTTAGLETVVITWKDLQTLRVVYCNNIKDSAISPALALHFSSLKELRWRPDTMSLLAVSLAGTGVGQKGGKFFKRGGPG